MLFFITILYKTNLYTVTFYFYKHYKLYYCNVNYLKLNTNFIIFAYVR